MSAPITAYAIACLLGVVAAHLIYYYFRIQPKGWPESAMRYVFENTCITFAGAVGGAGVLTAL